MEHLSIEFGIQLGPNHLTDFDYADDIVALGTSPNQLADFLSNFQQSAEKLGLKLNWTKTKIQNLGTCCPAPAITVNDEIVEGVEEFAYLGSKMMSSGKSGPEIHRRIGMGSSTMAALDNVWKQSRLSQSTKLHVYRSCVLSMDQRLGRLCRLICAPRSFPYEMPKTNPGNPLE